MVFKDLSQKFPGKLHWVEALKSEGCPPSKLFLFTSLSVYHHHHHHHHLVANFVSVSFHSLFNHKVKEKHKRSGKIQLLTHFYFSENTLQQLVYIKMNKMIYKLSKYFLLCSTMNKDPPDILTNLGYCLHCKRGQN